MSAGALSPASGAGPRTYASALGVASFAARLTADAGGETYARAPERQILQLFAPPTHWWMRPEGTYTKTTFGRLRMPLS